MKSEFWNPETVEALRKHVAEGYSAGAIYQMMKAPSRSAIIGKVWRLGLKLGQGLHSAEAARLRNRAERDRVNRIKDRDWGSRPRKPKAAPRPSRIKLEGRAPTEMVEADGIRLARMDGTIPPNAEPMSFLALPPRRCQWPIGPSHEAGSADMLCCGAPNVGDRSYCAVHARQAGGARTEGARRLEDRVVRLLARRAA